MTISYRQSKKEPKRTTGIYSLSGCQAKWGNICLNTPIQSQQDFLNKFGDYVASEKDSWLNVNSFLSYTPNLLFFRFAPLTSSPTFNGSNELTSVTGSSHSHIFVHNLSHATTHRYWKTVNGANLYFRQNDLVGEQNEPAFDTNQSLFIASKYAGEYGNNFSISMTTNFTNLSATQVFDESDPDVKKNYYFSELVDRNLTNDEFIVVVIKDYEIVESRICSTSYLDENFADNEEFQSIVIKVNPNVSSQVSTIQNEPLLFGVNTSMSDGDILAQIKLIGLSNLTNVVPLFFSELDSTIITEIKNRKIPSQVFIVPSASQINDALVVPQIIEGKYIEDPITYTTVISSYSGDIAGLLTQKLNSNSFSEIMTLPEREFQNILSVVEFEDSDLEAKKTLRTNIIERRGTKFFLEGNFSDINDTSLRRYLNIRILLLYVEVLVSIFLKSLIFETTIDTTEISEKMSTIRNSVKKYIPTFNYDIDVSGSVITVTLYETINKPYRTLVFDISYENK